MAEIAKLKKQSTAYKTHLTISINKLSEELNKARQDGEEVDVDLVKQYLQQVELKHEKWETSMLKIQDEDPDIDIDVSMDEINTKTDLVVKLRVKSKKLINKEVEVKVDEIKAKPHADAIPKVKDRMNLPKLQLKTFNGVDLEMFQEWFQMFDATINSSSLNPVEKFRYLKMSLEEDSEADKLIRGYPVTAANYTTVLQELQDAYGDREVVINYHVSKLLNLPKQTSPQSLKELYNGITTNVRSLDALGVGAESYSIFLVPIVKSKLDDKLRQEIQRKKIKDITELIMELKIEVEAVSSSQQVKDTFNPVEESSKEVKQPYTPRRDKWSNQPYRHEQPPFSSAQVLLSTSQQKPKYCIFCPGKQSHWVDECNKAKNIPPAQIKDIAMKENACLLCFKKGHRSFECRSRGRIKCEKCGATNHHTYLHEDNRKAAYVSVTGSTKESTETDAPKDNSPGSCTQENSTADSNDPTDVEEVKGAKALQARLGKESAMMPIMKVRLQGKNGKKLEVNAMLDQCAEATFIKQEVCKYLALDGPAKPIEVSGITGRTEGTKIRKEITTSLFNNDWSKEVEITLVEIPVICQPSKRNAVPQNILNNRKLRNLNLADSYLKDETKEIHILIGLDYYYHFITGRIKRGINQPVALETIFGWVLVSDSKNQELQSGKSRNAMCVSFISEEAEKGLNEDLKKFWEIEEGIIAKPSKPENEAAIQKFHDTVTYDNETKKYEVGLPYVNERELDSNFRKAEVILNSQLSRFEKKPELKEKYCAAMNEYIELGFAELVPEEEIYSKKPEIYYIPHSAVIKEENTTTKTRIVFNASASAKHQQSLNDKLLAGPKRQTSIPEILIRWRLKAVAVVADIMKMYSMIGVRKEDRDAMRFLWINEAGDIKHYRHTVLPFGVRSAPYLAIETVHSHIKKFSTEYPDVTESLADSTYVDDYCTSEETVEDAIANIATSNHIMTEAGMKLRKYKSNNPEVSKYLKEVGASIDTEDSRKVLGVHWKSAEDVLHYPVKLSSYRPKRYTSKRFIVGRAAKLHDPLGLISPVVVRAKILIQKLWSAGVEWDENLSGTSIEEEYIKWSLDLENLGSLEIPREYSTATKFTKKQLHIFNDASEDAYATVAYLRIEEDSENIHTAIVTSKTKVAPLKVMTIPRLELQSAVIGSRLSRKVLSALKEPNMKVYCWTDSSITLNWIKNTDVRWKTFVENCVVEVRQNSDPTCWRHCPGKENPADIASRGATVVELKEDKSWWGGPSWLRKSEEHWPDRTNSLLPNKEAMKEKRTKQYNCLVANTERPEPCPSPDAYSSFNTLLKKTAYLMRFPNNCRLKMKKKPLNLKEITPEEMSSAENRWLRYAQEEHYPEELAKLREGLSVKRDSQIVQLSPYLDEETGLIKMQGRIQHSALSEEEKHPVILPHKSPIVRLLIDEIHRTHMHSGINQTLVTLRDKYWVTHARSIVKSIVKSCLVCRMHMPQRLTVPFAPLPADRVTEAKPFEVIGIDFTGPVYIAETKQTIKRTKKRPVQLVKTKTTSKAYIALTTCAVTRAVHIELVPDLTTDSFMRSFRRFVSRRGRPSIIYSDNAKTYQAAEKGVIQCYELLNSSPFKEYLGEQSIQWKFICPLSPWWGGFWERFMKTIKLPLKKVLGRSFHTADEMYTLLTEVEAMANSRPLCTVNDDPEDINYLTPANFLIGRSTINLPVRPLQHSEVHPTATRKELNRMLTKQQKTLNSIWKIWREEHLRNLGVAPALKDKSDLKEGDLVMVSSNIQPRCTWRTARVTELREGRDGRIRSAVLQWGGKLYTRPIQLISKLEIAN